MRVKVICQILGIEKLIFRCGSIAKLQLCDMEFPVRCVSCGKVIGRMADGYERHVVKGGERSDEYLDKLKLRRQCCRVRFITFPWVLRDELNLYDGSKKSGNAKIS